MFFINTYSHPLIILLLPGLLFGLALTIPQFDKSRRQLIALLTFPILMILLWIVIMTIGLGLGILNNSNTDKTGVVILGILSSFLFTVVLDQFYPIENKINSYLLIIVLGVISTMTSDYLFKTSHSKELNLGKIILIWEIFIGLGLTIFVKYDSKKQYNKKNKNTHYNTGP